MEDMNMKPVTKQMWLKNKHVYIHHKQNLKHKQNTNEAFHEEN